MYRNELIQIEELRIRRGSFRLDIPSSSLESGQVIGLVGPNGAGKTTLLEGLAGLRPINGGSIRVFRKRSVERSGERPVRSRFHVRRYAAVLLKAGALMEMLSGYYPQWDETLVRDLMDRFRVDPSKPVENCPGARAHVSV